MKRAVWAVLIVAWCNLAHFVAGIPFITPGKKQSASTLKPFSLDDFLNKTITFRGFSGSWISDNEILLQSAGDLVILNVDTHAETKFLTADVLKNWNGSIPTLASNRKKVLFRYDSHSVFRHSTTARCDVYDLETKKTTQLQSNERLQLCVWSPTGEEVAYVYKNNIYYWDGANTHQLTDTGKEDVEYVGIPDWVYEEEVLQEDGALWFSPDGKKMAIGEFDDSQVSTFNIAFYSNPSSKTEMFIYPEELHLKYPKPGTSNPGVSLKVKELTTANNKNWTKLPAPSSIVSEDHILQSVSWIDNDNVLAVWLNRRQNVTSIQKCNIAGTCEQVTKMEEPKGWIMISKPRCYSSSNSCFFTYWIDNWIQIWQLDLTTGKNLRSSLGQFTVISIYGYKESTGDIFYLGTAPDHPEQRHVYRNSECLSCSLKDPDGVACTYAAASFSKDFSYYTITCSGPTPTYVRVYNSAGQKILDWEENTASRQKLEQYQKPHSQFLQIPVTGGYKAMVKLLLPPEINFDSPDPAKKYPMIVYVYGGPNSVRVTDAFSIGFEKYLTTSRKIIYAQIDGRGSGYKGKDMLFEINNRLGTVEIDDQIEVTKALAAKYSFIDPERIGIWGWSYGGYATAMALSRDRDHVFQCGISVAPVTSWIYYDTIYTERYMGLPTEEDNEENYIASDVTQEIDQFKNHDFMLIHGTGDDNVHYQQSLALAKALQLAGILFEQVSYPDEDHSLGNVQRHLYHTMDQFWGNCLSIEESEE